MIRDNNKGCPFGLSIPDSCLTAGNLPKRMSLSDGDEAISKANKEKLIDSGYCGKCIFAQGIFVKSEKVNCNYGDTAAGLSMPGLDGSPYYPSSLTNVNSEGLYGHPYGYYEDNSGRNSFYGLFSLLGKLKNDNLIKIAFNMVLTKLNFVSILNKDCNQKEK